MYSQHSGMATALMTRGIDRIDVSDDNWIPQPYKRGNRSKSRVRRKRKKLKLIKSKRRMLKPAAAKIESYDKDYSCRKD